MQENICVPIESTIWNKNVHVRTTNQKRTGPRPSQVKSFHFHALTKVQFEDLTEAQIDDLKNATREWKADYQVAGSIAHARELLEWESKQTERLDARIARQIKFLFELKAGEENALQDLACLAEIFASARIPPIVKQPSTRLAVSADICGAKSL